MGALKRILRCQDTLILTFTVSSQVGQEDTVKGGLKISTTGTQGFESAIAY